MEAERLIRGIAWAELHPDDDVRAARRAVVVAADALRAAHLTLKLAEARLALVEASFRVRQAGLAMLGQADTERPQ